MIIIPPWKCNKEQCFYFELDMFFFYAHSASVVTFILMIMLRKKNMVANEEE